MGPKKIILPEGQLLVITLIGTLILSALVYYKAVKAQRYLEPTLAISRPRIEFAVTVKNILTRELGGKSVKGVSFSADSIFVKDSLIFTSPVEERKPDYAFLKKLSRIFLAILEDKQMRPQFDLILIGTRVPIGPHLEMNKKQRAKMQKVSELIISALYTVEPRLEKEFGFYFAGTAIPVTAHKSEQWIEFRMIPSEHLHIEMIKSLGKYFF